MALLAFQLELHVLSLFYRHLSTCLCAKLNLTEDKGATYPERKADYAFLYRYF